jgi:hypothetical protein
MEERFIQYLDQFGTTDKLREYSSGNFESKDVIKLSNYYSICAINSIFGVKKKKFCYDKLRTWTSYQKAEFTNQSSYFQNNILFKLSEVYHKTQSFKISNKVNFQSKSIMLLQLIDDVYFEELNLDPNMRYYQGDRKLEKESMLLKGDNWISYRSVLLGGGRKFKDNLTISPGNNGTSDKDEEWLTDDNSNYAEEEFEIEEEDYEPRLVSESDIDFEYTERFIRSSWIDLSVDYRTLDYWRCYDFDNSVKIGNEEQDLIKLRKIVTRLNTFLVTVGRR